jgi:dGTPase
VAESDLEAALARVRAVGTWLRAYDGTRRDLAALKNLTSDLIGVFCGSVHTATRAAYGGEPLVRHQADLLVPEQTEHEIAVLKGIAAHYVMRSAERAGLMDRQRSLIDELFAALVASEGKALDPALREDYEDADDDAGRTRVVIDQIASLTDASAVTWHQRLCF